MRLFRNKPSRYLRMLLSKILEVLIKVIVVVNTTNVAGTSISWVIQICKIRD